MENKNIAYIEGYGNINMDEYKSIAECMCNTIDVDGAMEDKYWVEADVDLAEAWYQYKGFTKEDIKYIDMRGLSDFWNFEADNE